MGKAHERYGDADMSVQYGGYVIEGMCYERMCYDTWRFVYFYKEAAQRSGLNTTHARLQK
jgi:hypothetical protein